MSDRARDPADGRRLVLGTAIGYGVKQVRVFVELLRASGYTGDVTLLVRWPGLRLARYLRRHGVDMVPVVHIRSFTRSVHARRYAIYTDYLRARAALYDQVMVSDVRDVVFQRHPFEGIEAPTCHFFLEAAGHTIGADTYNSRWARGCLTAAQADALAPHRISCSGISIGATGPMLGYLERMTALVAAVPFRVYRQIGHGYDQALHNFLVHLAPEIDGTVVENNQHIATMVLEPPALYQADASGLIRLSNGHLPAICHQYDRFADLKAAVEARYRRKR